jgi:hypothetical protein
VHHVKESVENLKDMLDVGLSGPEGMFFINAYLCLFGAKRLLMSRFFFSFL